MSGGDWSGGDWESSQKPSPPPKTPAPRAPQPTPVPPPAPKGGRAIAALALGALVAVGAITTSTMSQLPKNTPASRAQWEREQLNQAAPDLKSRYASAQEAKAAEQRRLVEARDARAAATHEAKKLLVELPTFWSNYDMASRDAAADRLVALHALDAPRTQIEERLHQAAAWDALLRIASPQTRHWADVAARTEAWETVRVLDPNAYATTHGAHAFCLAGAQAEAEGVFEWLYKHPETWNHRPAAMACGLTPDRHLRLLSAAPRADELGVVSARENLQPLRARAFKNVHKNSRGSVEYVSLGAVLYLDDAIDARTFLSALNGLRPICTDVVPDLSANEIALPNVFVDAREKLESDKAPVNAISLEWLDAAAIHAALLHRVEPPVIARRGEIVERCRAQYEYETDPEAAQRRLQASLKASTNDELLAGMLALTAARAGDFETAVDAAQQLRALTTPGDYRRQRADWMLLAFGHKLGRLDTMDFSDAKPELIRVRDALLGDEHARAQMRQDTALYVPTALLAAYVRGALAPGQEELFADGHAERWPLSSYLFARAEGARWRGDTASETKWLERRDRMHHRARGGQNGGIQLLWTDN